jgi:hypothetical protein
MPRPARKTSILDPIKALGHGGLAGRRLGRADVEALPYGGRLLNDPVDGGGVHDGAADDPEDVALV